MNESQAYILFSILVLAVIGLLFAWVLKKGGAKPIRPLTVVAFAFLLAGILFDEDRFIGYGLMAVGAVLAVVDMLLKLRKRG